MILIGFLKFSQKMYNYSNISLNNLLLDYDGNISLSGDWMEQTHWWKMFGSIEKGVCPSPIHYQARNWGANAKEIRSFVGQADHAHVAHYHDALGKIPFSFKSITLAAILLD